MKCEGTAREQMPVVWMRACSGVTHLAWALAGAVLGALALMVFLVIDDQRGWL